MTRWPLAFLVALIFPAQAQALTPPSRLAAVAKSTVRVDLTWRDRSSREEYFQLQRARTRDFMTGRVTKDLAANSTSYVQRGLTPGTTYTFRIRACNGPANVRNCSLWSNKASATTKKPAPPPPPPPTTTPTTPTTPPPTTTPNPPPSGRWAPTKNLTWYWQLSGSVSNLNRSNAVAYDIDGFDTTSGTITTLHANGKKAICYVSAGTFEDWRPDAGSFPSSVLGSSNGWPGEKWLDVRSSALQPVMAKRIQMCADKGFDGVEFDNVDGYTNSTGFPLTAANQATYNTWLATTAHAYGLAAFLKNDVDQLATLQSAFDGAINEQCAQYSECGGYSVFVNANKPVLQAEYSGGSTFCSSANSAGRMAALFNVALNGQTFTPCWSISPAKIHRPTKPRPQRIHCRDPKHRTRAWAKAHPRTRCIVEPSGHLHVGRSS